MNNNQPVVEVLCEIHFIPSTDWDITAFGQFYDQIKDEYKKKEQEEPLSDLNRKIKGPGTRMFFHKDDGKRMIQLAKDTLIIHFLPPYPRWENFKSEITRQVNNYSISVRPQSIQNLGIRYINKFEFIKEGFSIDTVFSKSKFLPEVIFENKIPFILHLEHPGNKDCLVNITLGNIKSNSDDKLIFVFDIEILSTEIIIFEENRLNQKLDIYHDYIKEVFTECISDNQKKRLNLLKG